VTLTHELAQRDSPVRRFFEEEFPAANFREISKAWYAEVRHAEIVCPPPPGVAAGTVGTAFDYRARMCWAPIEFGKTVAALGARVAAKFGNADLRTLALSVGQELEALAPEARRVEPSDPGEVRVCQCCYVLALFEQFFRSLAARTASPLLDLPVTADIETILALAPLPAVTDIARMTEILCGRQPRLLDLPARLNPTFAGSAQIGGADADLIVDRTLIELKTTRQDRFERVDHIYQLLGYILLDYSEHFELDAIGVYLARRGVLVTWNISTLVSSCSTTGDLTSIRRSFRTAVEDASGRTP
jgi:hypothetical protein